MKKKMQLIFIFAMPTALNADTAGTTKIKMEKIYKNISGFGTLEKDDLEKFHKKHPAEMTTYGEITYDALQDLIEDPDINFTSQDIFYDLGSGVGKVAMQVHLNSPAKKSVGIELSETRHNRGMQAIKKLPKKRSKKKQLTLINDDILTAPIDDATIIFTCATCFPNDVMQKITKRLSGLKKGLRLMTLKKLPNAAKNNFTLIKEKKLSMTWSKNSTVYIYKLT